MKWTSGKSERTLNQNAANGRKEPIAEVSSFRCERSQHGNFCNSVKFRAALQAELQTFMKPAANLEPRIHKSRDNPDVCQTDHFSYH